MLEQVSSNSLYHGGWSLTQPSGLQPIGKELSLLYFVAQTKSRQEEETGPNVVRMTQGHEQWCGDCLRQWGMLRWGGKGEKLE